MRKKIISMVLAAAITASASPVWLQQANAEAVQAERQMEYLQRGTVAVRTGDGIYLSWRLLGTEPLTQAFDIYRDGTLIQSALDATNYTDPEGFTYSTYQVVPAGTEAAQIDLVCNNTEVWQQNYIDIPVDKPTKEDLHLTEDASAKVGDFTYSINDTSVGDVDGDGEYEYIIKWDPSNSRDNASGGYTGNVLLDCYKMDGTKLWRIDLGINIRAGAHYTQFMVYDFDGDGKAEVALRTAPGSKDGMGNYVSQAGAQDLLWKDSYTNETFTDQSDMRNGGGWIINGPDWLTMFQGENGAAMQTINYYPQRKNVKDWGDNYGNRSERYLAGVAYLNGQTPSLVVSRGYYAQASMAAYDWDGTKFTQLWGNTYSEKGADSLYGQGNHQLSVADLDNDGKDEIIFGSAAVDEDGSVLHNTGHGHGDALHVTDFNNDGQQEIFNVHEESTYYKEFGAEFRNGKTGETLGKVGAGGDNGRGVMGNVDDVFAQTHPEALSTFWSSADDKLHDMTGKVVTKTVQTTEGNNEQEVTRPGNYNFLIYWDGDLSRELLDRTMINKFTVENGTQRMETFSGVHSNNSSKSTPALSADLFGDWREEVAYGVGGDTALRIYTTVIPTDYKLTTLMHDSQYRCAVAWQNVAYNQPPHLSYYVGSASLKQGENYLDPQTGFDTAVYANVPTKAPVTPDISQKLLFDSHSFKNGVEGFEGGENSITADPYKEVLKVESSAVKTFDFKLEESEPTAEPTVAPTPALTTAPTPASTPTPVPTPTSTPTLPPAELPTIIPTQEPTIAPTEIPTTIPTQEPTELPTIVPTQTPTEVPTTVPTQVPTEIPTTVPTQEPTEIPTTVPTQQPTEVPTIVPTQIPAWDGITVKSFSLAGNTAALQISNASEYDFTATVVVAAYGNDGTLTGIKYIQKNILPSTEEYIDVSVDGEQVKAMLWSSMEDMQPVIPQVLTAENPLVENIQIPVQAEEKIVIPVEQPELDTVQPDSSAEEGNSGTVLVSFDWNPGSSVQFTNTAGENIITFSKENGASIRYTAGKNQSKTINASLTQAAWYHIEMTLDFTSKTADISVMDYTNNGEVKTVYSASFAGVNGILSKMTVTGASMIDNVVVSQVQYHVPRSLIQMQVKDEQGSPVENAVVSIGGKKLTADAEGKTAIKLNSGEYSYTVTKEAYKISSGTVNASADVAEAITLSPGETRNVYVSYKFNQELEIKDAVSAGQAQENTTYTVPDATKGDVEYTFASDPEQLPPGYEGYAGKTFVFEYDPDNSETVDRTVLEGADTYINLAYRIKRVPAVTDTQLLRINMSGDGVGRDSWSGGNCEFMQDEALGVKYANFTNISSNPVSIAFENTSGKIVIEYDIMYKDLDWGGNIFGMTPYSDTTAGKGFGIRTSSSTTNQWNWVYLDGRNTSYMPGIGKPGYVYNWKNQWTHVVVVCDGTQLKATIANKNSGTVYYQDAVVPLSNDVGTASKPIDKLVFGRISGKGDANIGISNVKVYTVDSMIPSDEIEEKVLSVPSETDLSYAPHITEVEGVTYDVSGLLTMAYELRDENGSLYTGDDVVLSADGKLTVNEGADRTKTYQVLVKYNEVLVKAYSISIEQSTPQE